MPEFRERPKMDRPKARPSTAAPPRQAARLMKEKYRQQLDQRPEKTDGEANYATDRVEGAGRRATDEVVSHTPRLRQKSKNPLKERPRTEAKTDPAKANAPQTEPLKPKQRPADRPKTKEPTQPKTREAVKAKAPDSTQGQRSAKAPRQRETPSRTTQATTKAERAKSQAVPRVEDKKAMLAKTRQSQPLRQRPLMGAQEVISAPPGRSLASGASTGSHAPKPKPQRVSAFKEHPGLALKTRSGLPASKPTARPMKIKPPAARAAKKAARQTVQKQMTQRMVAQAQKAAKATMTATKKAAEAVVRAVAALISGLVGLLGGGVLLALLLLVAIVAAVASSPFGIFFAGGGSSGGSSAPPTVSVAEAVSQINMEYNARLESLQAGGYDSIEMAGAAPEWPDVLAAFASRYAAADDGVDVATLDDDRVSKLKATFWDMCTISSTVQSIHHPGTPQEDGTTTGGWTEYILHITITAKTAEDMKGQYNLDDFQKDAMNELLSDRAALSSLAGSLDIVNAEALAVLNDLPADLSPDRCKAVETALQLVGKVNYFWGGKSYVIGWDSRWGQLAKVTADGSPSTGTYRPYGLDCTGFIDWTLRNAGLPSDGHWFIGTNLSEVSQVNALPGDIALYPDASHVGMVVGRDSAGKLLVCHCSSGNNNVVVTEYTASGFTVLGRPSIYSL